MQKAAFVLEAINKWKIFLAQASGEKLISTSWNAHVSPEESQHEIFHDTIIFRGKRSPFKIRGRPL